MPLSLEQKWQAELKLCFESGTYMKAIILIKSSEYIKRVFKETHPIITFTN